MHLFGGFAVDRAIDPDHAAESRDRITFQSEFEGLCQCPACGRATGIGVLDDGANGFVEFLCKIPGGLQINNVVVGELLALQLAGVGDTRARPIGVHGGLLMGILPVAQVERLLERETQNGRKHAGFRRQLVGVGVDALQRGGDGGVVSRGCGKCFLRQTPFGLPRDCRRRNAATHRR